MPPRAKRSSAVREPIQVYLTPQERGLLDRVAAKAGLSRAEVLRNGLRRYGAEVLAESHPVLAFLDEMAAGWPSATPSDVSARHDEYLADTYSPRSTKKRR
jgi:hypothetical protein